LNTHISLSKAAFAAFAFSLPLTGFSLIQSEGMVRAFAPSLFLSLPFVALNILKRDVLRSLAVRQVLIPILVLCVAGVVSIWLNALSPATVLVHTPDMVIQEPNTGLSLLERYFRLVYSMIVLAVLVGLVMNNQKTLGSFCRSFVAGYSLGAIFGFGQFMADLLHIPFWSPFGGARWMQSNQSTDFGIRRINGGAPEPSHWAPFSLMAIAFILISADGKFSRRRWMALGLAVFNLVFTLSGSAIVGLSGLVAGFLLLRVSRMFSWKVSISKTLVFAIGFPLLLGAAALLVTRLEVLNAYFGEGLLRKISGQSDSGAVRLYIMVLTWLAFVEHPLYGVGVGTIASFNTVLTILASGGLFLFLPYGYMIASGGYRTFKAYRGQPTTQNLGWFILFWSMLFITTFSYGEIFSFFSWIWIFFSFVRKPQFAQTV
jgi:hypothetical protein